MNDEKSRKERLRKRLLARREANDRPDNTYLNQKITDHVSALPEIKSAAVICVYVAASGEVATRRLIDEFVAANIVVVVPRIIDRTTMYAVQFRGWEHLRPGPLGILAPQETLPWEKRIDVAIIPGLGFTAAGGRLGFGAGYYDRWIPTQADIVKIGVGFQYQIVESIPLEPHDVAMDLIVTEAGANYIATTPK